MLNIQYFKTYRIYIFSNFTWFLLIYFPIVVVSYMFSFLPCPNLFFISIKPFLLLSSLKIPAGDLSVEVDNQG